MATDETPSNRHAANALDRSSRVAAIAWRRAVMVEATAEAGDRKNPHLRLNFPALVRTAPSVPSTCAAGYGMSLGKAVSWRACEHKLSSLGAVVYIYACGSSLVLIGLTFAIPCLRSRRSWGSCRFRRSQTGRHDRRNHRDVRRGGGADETLVYRTVSDRHIGASPRSP